MKALLYFSILLFLIGRSGAAEVVLAPVQDRDVYQGSGMPTTTDYSLGVSSSVALGGGHSQKSVIQFDVTAASTGLAAAQVGSAKLQLYVLPPEVYPSGQNIGGDVLLSYQTKSWSETSLRWATFSAGAPINTLTLIGDRPYNDGRGTTIYAINTWVEVDVTAAVKAWLAGTQANHGFLLEPDEVNTPSLSAVFADSLTGWKPRLVITPAIEAAFDFKVTSFSVSGTEIALTWTSRPGRKYRVKESPDLASWQVVAEFTAEADLTSGQIAGSSFPEGRAFYAVEEIE